MMSGNSTVPITTSSVSSLTSETESATTSPTPTVSEPSTTTTTSSSSATTEAPSPTTTSSAPPLQTSDEVITSVITETQTSGSSGATTVIITSTASLPSQTNAPSSNGASPATTTGEASSLPSSTDVAQDSSGLSAGGTIAVAVVVPVVSVALIILALIFWWRKRRARKLAEEERRKEVEEYGFNPNNDPTLPHMGMATNLEPKDDNSGYRGWGTTSNTRKPSTNLSSGPGVGISVSSDGSAPGYHHAASPSEGTIQYSDGQGIPTSADSESVGVLGAIPAGSNNRNTGVHRGLSNASSAYSTANRSEGSEDSPVAGVPPAAYYDESPYYSDVQQHGPYGDVSYGGVQPVIRDVQARRNTRIESPSVFPKQGNAGIAQNF